MKRRQLWQSWAGIALGLLLAWHARAGLPETIERIKPSLVVVGLFNKLKSPPFTMRGTGFAVADGRLIATNAHVLPDLNPEGASPDQLAILVASGNQKRVIPVQHVARDSEHDLALLRFDGPALPALTLGDSDTVREGQSVAFSGFPIGSVLGFSPVTHRGIVSSITAISVPSGNASQLKNQSIRTLRSGAFPIFQLDATAYPGNSGGPLFDAESGEVIGIINMVFIKSTKESVLEKPSGISYAIPAKHLVELLRRNETQRY